jgi:hypothetical protein
LWWPDSWDYSFYNGICFRFPGHFQLIHPGFNIGYLPDFQLCFDTLSVPWIKVLTALLLLSPGGDDLSGNKNDILVQGKGWCILTYGL